MKKHAKLSTDIALLIFLAAVVSLIIFPVLGNASATAVETTMLDALSHSGGPGELGSIFKSSGNIFTAAYLHLVELIGGLFPQISQLLLLRLPGALVVLVMTLCLFRFDGGFDRLNASFLASLLFLSCAIIVDITFHASAILIPASLFIFAMMSLYHWLHHGTRRYFGLVVLSSAISTTIIGATAPLSMAIMAYTFIAASQLKAYKRYAVITAALLLSCVVAFLAIYVLVGDSSVAMGIFRLSHQLEPVESIGHSMTRVFVQYVVVGIFPWSIPLILSFPWLLRNPRKLLRHFINLSLLQRYGIIIFLFSLPMLLFSTALSGILLIVSLFFNMPLIGKYLLLQFNQHPSVWRITGAICATIVGIGTCAFVAVNTGVNMPAEFDFMQLGNGWSKWCVFITAMIFVSMYTLWRSVREIGHNNRFLYNIIMLYLFAVALAIGYIFV